MFKELSGGFPPPTIKAVAEHWQLPYETVRGRWADYKAAVATGTTPLSPLLAET